MIKCLLIGLLLVTTSLQAQVLIPPKSAMTAQQLQQLSEVYQTKQAFFAERVTADKQKNVYLNALILENSPYLIRHATNPVNWRAWSVDAFALAKAQNKPIFLSIGYSTCHWCHVMEQDSFVKKDIGALINQHFIAIKVDRELQPAVDELYTDALRIATGSSGWPITAVLNDKGEPVFINSFLAHDKLIGLLKRLTDLWQTNQGNLNQNAASIMALIDKSQQNPTEVQWPANKLEQTANKLVQRLDPVYGGFAGVPKFPNEAMMLFLLDQFTRSGDPKQGRLLQLQLDQMIAKGLYDPVNGGFHRYSTDRQWQLPHFEKMLYNQGQLLLVYSEAARIFGDQRYHRIIKGISDFLRQWLYQPTEGLYSAIDADYQGEDGKYYSWTAQELQPLSPEQKQAAGLKTFALHQGQRKVVYFNHPNSPAAHAIRSQLSAFRATIKRPMIDQKILTSWNALAVWGLAEAYQVTGDEALKTLAFDVAQTLWSKHYSESQRFTGSQRQLNRATLLGQVSGEPGALDDYAFFAKAMLELFDISQDTVWLLRAVKLAKVALIKFKAADQGFFMTDKGLKSALQVNLKPAKDTELLAPAAVMVEVLQDLWRRTGEVEFKQQLKQSINYLKGRVQLAGLNHLTAAKVINQFDNKVNDDLQYFAGGRGRVTLNNHPLHTACIGKETGAQNMTFDLHLQPGWHVNSATPLQNHLKATKVSFESPDTRYKVNYPEGKITTLGFQQQPLSVYDGQFSLSLIQQNQSNNQNQGKRINLHLQACSDKLCLLPEVLTFYVAACGVSY